MLALLKVDLAIVLLVDGLLTIATYVYSRQKSLKLYPYLKNNHEERDLSALENTKHVFAHKISGVVLSNTDPILLSVFVATSVTNIYNAYNLICSSLTKDFYLALCKRQLIVLEIYFQMRMKNINMQHFWNIRILPFS